MERLRERLREEELRGSEKEKRSGGQRRRVSTDDDDEEEDEDGDAGSESGVGLGGPLLGAKPFVHKAKGSGEFVVRESVYLRWPFCFREKRV